MYSSLVIDFIHQTETLSKTKLILVKSIMISKDSESVCQSYPLHLLWESPFTCFLFSQKDMETPLHRCLTGQGWSLTGLEYIKIRALRDTSTISHMQALLHLYDSSDCGIYI